MKRTYLLFAAIVLLCTLPVVAAALNEEIKIFVNGKNVEASIAPQVHDGVVFLPTTMLEETLKLSVSANAKRDAVSILYDKQEIYIEAGNETAYLDGKAISLSAAPYMEQGEMFIPMNSLSVSLGLKVNWDAFTSSVFIFKKVRSIVEVFQPTPAKQTQEDWTVENAGDSLALVSEIISEQEQVIIQFDALPERKAQISSDANRLIIDFPQTAFGATLNGKKSENLGTVDSATTGVERIRYSYFKDEPPTIRIVLDSAYAQSHELVEVPELNQIIVKLSKPNVVYKVVIDAGHGGKDPGAEGASTREEKHFTLELSKRIHSLLQKEPAIEAYLSREDDTFISLDDRAAYANQIGADLFVSIHGNTYEKPVSGTETYYWDESSYKLAEVMHRYALEGTGLPDRNIRRTEFRVLVNTKMPSVLLELGYLSNAHDEEKMLTDAFQERTAESIVRGIKVYLGLDA